MIQTKELTKLESFLPLIYDLQEETWPHDHLSRKAVLDKIIQIAQILGVNLNPNDPEFLTAVMIKIWEISFQPPKLEAPSIPPHLAEFLEDYDKAKREQQEEIRKKLGTQENYDHYQKLTNEFEKIIVRIDSRIPGKLATRMAETMANETLSSLPTMPMVQEEEKNQVLNKVKDIIDKKFEKIKSEEAVIKEAEEIVSKEEKKIVEQKEEVVSETGKIVENEWQKILEETQKIIPPPQIIQPIKEEVSLKIEQPLVIKKEALSLSSSLSPKEKHIFQEFMGEVKKTISLAEPRIKGKELDLMAKNVTDEIITSLPIVVPGFLNEEDKKLIADQSLGFVQEEFKKIGKEPQNKINIQPLVSQIQPIMEPKIISAVKEAKLKEILPLPKAILAKLNQATETIYPLPAYTHLNPKAASEFFIKKTANRPSARLIEFAVKNAPPEWQASKNWPIIQEMVEKRIFAENLQENVNFFKKMGVPTNHPLIQQFEDKIAKLLEVQKNPKTGQDHPWVKILKKDSTAWSQGFNRFRSIVNIYERFSKFVTKGNYVSFLTPVRQFFYKKITQPIVGWLAKTAVGKAAQQGAKKAATWIAAKLGMKLAATAGIAATGAATGPPGWVVAAVTIVLDILKALGRKIIGFVRRIIQEPDKALGSVGVGILLLIFIPSPLKLIAILPLAVGGLGLMTFIAAPATLGVIGGGVSAFFIAIAAIPIAAPIALFIIILFSVLAGLTLFIVLVVSGAFILPGKMAEVTPTVISPYESPYFELKKTADPAIMDNILPGNNAEITYKITITAKDKKLTIIGSINEEISLSTNGNPSKPQAHSFDEDLQEKGREINPGGTWEVEYSINVDSSFNDTAIINTVHVELAADEVAGRLPGTTSASVIIGEPPGDCPDSIRWPTCGIYTQGPWGLASHWPHGEEAIDIHNADGTAIYATHNGTAILGHQNGTGAGNYVIITGSCQGTQFQTWYMHMRETGRASGKVVKGQIIGYMSNSGTGGVHLHYEFRTGDGARRWPYGGAPGVYTDNKTIPSFPPLMPMAPPYIPFALDRVSVVRTDENGNTSGVTIQPTFGSCLIKSVYSP